MDITNDSEASQTATATAKNGVDLGQLLLILLLIFGGGFIFSMFGIVMKFVLKGAQPPKAKPPSIGALHATLETLKAKLAAKSAVRASLLAKPTK